MTAPSTDPIAAPEAPPVEVLPYATPPARKLWHVGTLTYTTAGLAVLFCWLLWGDFTFFLKERAVPPSLQVLLRKFGASAMVGGLLIGSLPQIIHMFVVPIVSYKSDRHRGRWGRRIPFLLAPTPLAVISMVGLAYSPVLGRALHHAMGPQPSLTENGCIILCLGICWTLFEIATWTCNAVFGALVNDVVPREVIGRFFGLFRALSLIAGILFNWKLLGIVEMHYVPIFIGLAMLYGVSFTVMCMRVKEGKYPPPPPEVSASPIQTAPLRRVVSGVETYVLDCFTKPYYLWFFLSFGLAHMGFQAINLYSLWFASSVHMSDDTYGKWGALQLTLSLIQAYPIGWLADKFHPLRITMIALAMYATSTLIAFFLVRDSTTFAAAHVICGTISGFYLTATSPLGPVLLPRAKFATLLSANGIFIAVGSILVGPILGRFLDRVNPGKAIGNYDYHYIYLWASTFVALSLGAMFFVYRRFKAYGGPKHYVAPE